MYEKIMRLLIVLLFERASTRILFKIRYARKILYIEGK